MTKIKNVVPYLVGIGALAVGVSLVKKKFTTKQVILPSIPEESTIEQEMNSWVEQRNYIELATYQKKEKEEFQEPIRRAK